MHPKLKRLTRFGGIAVAAFLLVTLGKTAARADIITFDLSAPNSAVSGYPAPYVEVTIDLINSTTANVTFLAQANGSDQYFLTDGSSAALNVSSSVTVSNVSGNTTPTGGPAGPFTVAAPPGTQSADGFGKFNVAIDDFDSFKHAVEEITFTLTDTSGTWSSASAVLLANAAGYFAASHIGVCVGTPCAAFAATGFAGNGTVSPVPEPGASSLFLFGALVFGLSLYMRRGEGLES